MKFLMHYFQFSKQNFTSKANNSVVSMFDDTLIEHALSTKDNVCYIRTLLSLDFGHDDEIKKIGTKVGPNMILPSCSPLDIPKKSM